MTKHSKAPQLYSKSAAAALMGLAASVTANPALAQEAPEPAAEEEIIVTARLRAESVQDIGAGVSAIGSAEIEGAGLTDFEDIARRTVGLNIVDRGPNQNDVAMRGIANGVPPQTSDGGNLGPLVTQYFDEIEFSSPTSAQRDINLFDINRVEIIRGPQPTIFGEGAVGGAIRYFSADPELANNVGISGHFSASAETTEDGDESYNGAAAVDLTLSPGVLGVRVMAFQRNDGGFIDNPLSGAQDANDFESQGGRVAILFEPNNRFRARLSAHMQRDTPGEDWAINAVNEPDQLTFSSALPAVRSDDFDLYSGILSYRFDTFTLTSVTGYVERQGYRNTFDAGNTGAIAFLYPAVADPSVFSAVSLFEETFSQELRFVSDFDGPINLIAGVLYTDNKTNNIVDVQVPGLVPLIDDPSDLLPGNAAFTQLFFSTMEQYSAFAEVTWDVSDRVRVIAGARYVNQDLISGLDAAASAALGSPAPIPVTDFVDLLDNVLGLGSVSGFQLEEVLPRLAFEYDVSDDILAYANIAKGVRNGNLNSPLSAIGAPDFEEALTFEPDQVWAYEVGLRSTLMGGDLTLNTALFYNDFQDPQIQVIPVATQLYANGPDSRSIGVEFEARYRINDIWNAYLNAAYTDAEFTSTQSLGAAGVVAEGNSPAGIPEFTFSTGADFRYALSGNMALVGRADFQFIDSRYATPQNFATSELGALEILNLRLGIENDIWSLTGYIENATNDLEYQAVAVLSSAPGAPRTTAHVNRPRTIGVTLAARF